MRKKRGIIDNFYLFLKGLAMGAANKVPGVSGGTVSYVLDFYEELIFSFRKINLKSLRLLLNGRVRSFFEYTNSKFLLFVMGGSIVSYFSVSLILDYFLKHYELYVWSFFFGLIIGSIYYIFKDFGKWSKTYISFLVLGVFLGIAITFVSPATENDNLWFVFFCGIIGVSGMTFPGLSGSFILILLGNYVLLLVDSVNALFSIITNILTGNFEVLSDPNKVHYLKIISVFFAGSVFGLISISHILGYFLKKYNKIVNALIIGFITGSLGIVWPWKNPVYLKENASFKLNNEGNKIIENYERFLPDLSASDTLIAILFIVLGVSLVLIIDYYDRKRK